MLYNSSLQFLLFSPNGNSLTNACVDMGHLFLKIYVVIINIRGKYFFTEFYAVCPNKKPEMNHLLHSLD